MGGRGATSNMQRKNVSVVKGDPRAPFRDLPPLQGSPAQISWANEIRSAFFQRVERSALPGYQEDGVSATRIESWIGRNAKEIDQLARERAKKTQREILTEKSKFTMFS